MWTKALLLICLHFTFLSTYSQNDVRRIDVSGLPEEIRDLEDISLALRWTDSLGDNVVVIIQKTYRPSDDVKVPRSRSELVVRKSLWSREKESFSDRYKEAAPPFAHHYLLKGDSATLWRKTTGTGMKCAIDTKGNRLKSAIAVTDVNKDGVAEVWFIVKTLCVDDEAPNGMKIFMTSGTQRYVMSGTRIWHQDGKTIGGTYYFDEAFKNAPETIKRYADLLWKRNAKD